MKNISDAVSLPVARQYLNILGIRTAIYQTPNFEKEHSKEAVILLHGGAPGVSAELCWFKNFHALQRAGYRVLAFDQPGFGFSSPPENHSIDFRYQHFTELLIALNLKEAHLCGSSIGGLLCSLYALSNPRTGPKAISLILSAPYPYFEPPAIAQEQLIEHRARLSSVEPTYESIRALCENTFNQKSQVTDEIIAHRLSMLEGDRWDAYQARKSISRKFDKKGTAGLHVNTPTLIVWGVEDRSLPYEIGIEAMKWFSHGRFLFLTQCGHWPQTEQAHTFNQEMLDFLRSA